MSTSYLVKFDRIGRNRNVRPLRTAATDADDLASKIYTYARPHLLSRDVEVLLDLAEGKGSIFCGWNNGGSFAIVSEPAGSTL